MAPIHNCIMPLPQHERVEAAEKGHSRSLTPLKKTLAVFSRKRWCFGGIGKDENNASLQKPISRKRVETAQARCSLPRTPENSCHYLDRYVVLGGGSTKVINASLG